MPSAEPGPRRRLVLIHGRGRKPPAADLERLWREALRRGIERDHEKRLKAFDALAVSFVYYGDLIAPIVEANCGPADAQLDLADLETALAELAARESTKQFRSQYYYRMRRRSGTRKLLMLLSSPFARGLRLDDRLVATVSPELARYRADPAFADAIRRRLLDVLQPALAGGESVMLIAHCLGSVVAYDCLWQLSRGDAPTTQKLQMLVTLGAPLANDAVRMGLLGAREPLERRYPGNITHWFNVAAEDDYVCHDTTVADDFAPMLERRMISRLEDYGIFNLARRYGKSNPHNALGYLVHPRTAAILADWLRGPWRAGNG